MIRSMTGYGRGEGVLHDRAITVEVRAVNNRYLDCAVKIPRLYVFAEESIKAQVQKQVGRGKVDVLISIDATAADKVAVSLNRSVADGYYTALTQMRDAYNLKDDISVSLLSRFPDVFLVEKEQGDADVIAADLLQVLSQALEGFNAMREREGQKLAEDIRAKAAAIAALVEQVEVRSPETVAAYREKLRQRMQEVLENTQIDESRILTEAAIFADKVAVDEETVRLRSHLSQLEDMLEKFLNDNVPVGDIPPDVHPRFGQVDEAVGLIVHIAHAFQRLQRAGDGGAGHARRLRDGTGAGRAFPDFLMEDDF